MTSVFSGVNATTLSLLAEGFETGRLSSGSQLALAPFVAEPYLELVSREIGRLLGDGMRGDQIAYLFRAIATAKESSNASADAFELVWTGPDPSNVSTRETGVVLRELFGSARFSVLVVGFAIHQGKDVFRVLAERMDANPELSVTMFLNIARGYRDTTIASELIRRFADDFKNKQWPGSRFPKVYFDPRALSAVEAKRASLHAKCVVVDGQRVFITSANFTEAAQERNLEIGVLVSSRACASPCVV